ncbi:hypothetical protein [Actinomadura parmotrematis]|uniref:DUF5709 domain-containing protein n=1 Tax=Actinomadura parmotrematis TaxID=2864039 RepID=A0ABS7FMI5_9ACTN|nr:hypothetical protein [Actinomadura parmotrematis]MBW8481593.1 hypothetical protein [Actinomadura parmotrematis]
MSEPRFEEERPVDDEGRYEDDLGDDEQESEIEATERYIEDPPDDLVIEESADGPIGIREYMRGETREGEDEDARDDLPAEEAALEVEDRQTRRW